MAALDRPEDEPVPIRIVAGKTRDFETEHEADAGKRHLGR